MRKLLAVGFALAVVCAAWLAGAHAPTSRPMPPWLGLAIDRRPATRTFAEGAWTLYATISAHPIGALSAAGAIAVVAALSALAKALPHPVQQDPVRMFTAAQRATGFDRAGGRCEGELVPFVRCTAAAAHGDHWYPHTLGGATSMDNFVALCVRHNTSKGAKVPTFFQTLRLERRRRRYFQPGEPVRPGQQIMVR